MSARCFGLGMIVFALALSASAQGTTEEELAASKRRIELLRHPTFITLRLISIPHDVSREGPSDTPLPYTVGDRIDFQLLVSQSLAENLVVWNTMWPYHEVRPELIRDGDILPLSKTAQERVDRAATESPSGSMALIHLTPGRQCEWLKIKIEDWYEPLSPGHYQLSVRQRFIEDGDWIQSNPVVFDVQARKAATPIPKTVTVKVVPSDFQEKPEEKIYRLGNEVQVTVLVVNNSDQRIKVDVIDLYYGNRLQLFKNGVLVPYREETAKLIQSKDESPRLVDVSSNLFLDPHTSSGLQNLNLKDWYGPLAPGSYRLIDRRRLEIDGPWTANSAELLFVIPQP